MRAFALELERFEPRILENNKIFDPTLEGPECIGGQR
jgi:hypothetical protein